MLVKASFAQRNSVKQQEVISQSAGPPPTAPAPVCVQGRQGLSVRLCLGKEQETGSSAYLHPASFLHLRTEC